MLQLWRRMLSHGLALGRANMVAQARMKVFKKRVPKRNVHSVFFSPASREHYLGLQLRQRV